MAKNQGFSMSLLFLLVALAAIVAAALRNVPFGELPGKYNAIFTAALVGSICGGLVTFLGCAGVGLRFFRALPLVVVGAGICAVVGAMVLIPVDNSPQFISQSMLGCFVLLVGLLLANRFQNRKRTNELTADGTE